MNKTNYFEGFDCWSDGKNTYESNSVTYMFEITMPEPEYVWATYESGGYDGSAIVIYKQGNNWYQVYGSHCSCYGLEGQWEPEILDIKLHFEALAEGKSLIAGYGMDSVKLNEWLKEVNNL